MKPGVVAEFDGPEALLRAVRELRQRGYQDIDAFTPYPVRELEAALGTKHSPVHRKMLPVGLFTAVGAYLAQWFVLLLAWAGLFWRAVHRERATIDRFFLGVDASDPSFDCPRLASELLALGAARVTFLRIAA